MLDPNIDFAEPLQQGAVSRSARFKGKVLILLSLLVTLGLAALLSPEPSAHDVRQHFAVQEPLIALASAVVSQFPTAQLPRRSPRSPLPWLLGSPVAGSQFQAPGLTSFPFHRSSSLVRALNWDLKGLDRFGLPEYQPNRPISGQESLSGFVNTSAGVQMPRLIYATAMKKTDTEKLVLRALRAGFRGIDTANEPKYYNEPAVGAALANVFASGLKRERLFIQTMVSPAYASFKLSDGSVTDQVALSVRDSLKNLGVDYVDSLVLHFPYAEYEHTVEAWKAMEAAVQAGKVKQLGIGNIQLDELQRLYADVTIKPAVVQQKGFQKKMYPILAWCREKGVYFQSIGALVTHKRVLESTDMQNVARKTLHSQQVCLFRYLMGLGIVPVAGPKEERRMKEYLGAREADIGVKRAEEMKILMTGGKPLVGGNTDMVTPAPSLKGDSDEWPDMTPKFW